MMKSAPILSAAAFVLFSSCFASGRGFAQTSLCSVPFPGEVFCDDFRDGDPYDGSPVSWVGDQGGAISIDGEGLILTKTNNPVPLAVPSIPPLSDVSIQARVRLFEGQSIGVAGRRTSGVPVTNYYAYLYEDNDGKNYAGIEQGSTLEEIDSVEIDFDVRQEDVILQLDIFGNHIIYWAWPADQPQPAEPLGVGVDEALTSGSIFLWAGSQGLSPGENARGAFRYVRVATIPQMGLAGDFDSDGTYSCNDLDLLYGEFPSGMNDPLFDLSGDGEISVDDVDSWLTMAGATRGYSGAIRPGDTNLDGLVDASDLNDLALNWQATHATSWCQGDFNLDGQVDAADLNKMGLNWQSNIALQDAPLATVVPEPSAFILVLLSILWLFGLHRRW